MSASLVTTSTRPSGVHCTPPIVCTVQRAIYRPQVNIYTLFLEVLTFDNLDLLSRELSHLFWETFTPTLVLCAFLFADWEVVAKRQTNGRARHVMWLTAYWDGRSHNKVIDLFHWTLRVGYGLRCIITCKTSFGQIVWPGTVMAWIIGLNETVVVYY